MNVTGQGTYPEKVAADYLAFDRLYGLDQNLVNGIRYKPEYPGSDGHPFLEDWQITAGSVRINNLLYNGVRLGYNIHNQTLILEYLNFAGAPEQIVLHNKFIDEFTLGEKQFKKMAFEETGTAFFQVIKDEEIRCLYLWSKSLNRSTTSVSGFYFYSDPKRKIFLWKDGQLFEVNSKKSFVKRFDVKHQKPIKQFFKQWRIQMKSVTDSQMHNLLRYCNGLSED